MTAAAHATDDVLEEPAPHVLQTSLDDFYVRYELNAVADGPDRMALTYSQLYQNILDRFNEAGVEIMSPHCSSIRDGNAAAIPADHLPGDYTAPGFRLLATNAMGGVPGGDGQRGS
jgi:small-conductance mechanosensitive channel